MRSFKALGLADWQLDAQQTPQGGQSGVCAVVSTDGVQGVFRCLPPNPDVLAVDRFKREVTVLGEINHSNVVRLLEYSLDSPYWYISPRGVNLKSYWDSISERQGQPYRVALEVIRGLAAGLVACHRRDVVHRDIKPNNIVVHEGEDAITPVLIDFGVVWLTDEDRLTPLDQAVGNAQYSPDAMRRRQEQYATWNDVFMLVQVFLWLVAQRDVKHFWQRPVHWRYVTFPDSCPQWFADALRALAAATSIFELSPKDASELLELMDSLFLPSKDGKGDNMTVNKQAIQRGLAAGTAAKTTREAADREVVLAAQAASAAFVNGIRDLFLETVDDKLISIASDSDLREMFELGSGVDYEQTCVELRCGVQTHAFKVRLRVVAYLPSYWERKKQNPPPTMQTTNPFVCYLQRYGGKGDFPSKTYVVSQESNGDMILRNEDLSIVEAIDLARIREIIAELVSDEAAWAAIGEVQ